MKVPLNIMTVIRWITWLVMLATFVYLVYVIQLLDLSVNHFAKHQSSGKKNKVIGEGETLGTQAHVVVENLSLEIEISESTAHEGQIEPTNYRINAALPVNVESGSKTAHKLNATADSVLSTINGKNVSELLLSNSSKNTKIGSNLNNTSYFIDKASYVTAHEKTVTMQSVIADNHEPVISKQSNISLNYTIDTPGCKIPFLNPFDPSILDLYIKLPPLECKPEFAPLLFVKGNKIYLNKTAVNTYGNVSCSYIPFFRKDDNHVFFANESFPISEVTKVFHEFVFAQCKNSTSSFPIYRDYFAFIVKKPSVEKRCNAFKTLVQKSLRLNVLMLGLDSTSRNQFIRHMPETLAFLRTNMTTVEMIGYNKIGSNTYPNMMPLLTGHLSHELPNTEHISADCIPIIWKNFSEIGYRVQYSEDTPSISLFNYARKGFDNEPVDYYLRPYSLAIQHEMTAGCFGHRAETTVILNWTKDFYDVFPHDPLFSFVYLTRLSHNNLNTMVYNDRQIVEFLNYMRDQGHLNHSVIFVFGDHGLRFGEFRERFIGQMEEKLPAMFVSVPEWFPEHYPQLYKNLKSHAHTLTTPLDIFETLYDILHFTGQARIFDQNSRSSSLFSNASLTRTCLDAAVDPQWCSCIEWESIPVKDDSVIHSADFLVERINNITLIKRSNCAEVYLEVVVEARVLVVSIGETWTKANSTFYQIVFQVKPSGGIFEGTVWKNRGQEELNINGNIDRINRYGNQSACVNLASLKPFCYCV